MTQTVPLQVKLAIRAMLEGIPGVYKAYLNRAQAIGENETERGAVIVLREEMTRANTDNQITLPLTIPIRFSVYVDTQVAGPTVDELVDPYWQAINAMMHGPVRSLSGVQGVRFLEAQHEAEGDAGRTDLIYNLMIRVSQLDLTQPSS